MDLASAYVQKKMNPEVIAQWQAVITLDGNPALAAASGEVYRTAGFPAFLQNLLDHFQDPLAGEHAYDAARTLTLLGKKNEAVSSLQEAFTAREGQMIYLKCDPAFEPLRSDPDFQALVKKMRFPE